MTYRDSKYLNLRDWSDRAHKNQADSGGLIERSDFTLKSMSLAIVLAGGLSFGLAQIAQAGPGLNLGDPRPKGLAVAAKEGGARGAVEVGARAETAGFKSRALAADSNGSDWLLKGRNYYEQHYSPLDQINQRNVEKLGLLWSIDIPSKDGLSATPIVADGVAYLSAPFSRVYAVDARTGALRWSFDPKVKLGTSFSNGWTSRINRGVALWDGKVYVGTADCRLIALNASSGKVQWETKACDASQEYGIDAAPLVANGKVFIGNGVSDFGARGYLSAFDAESGKELWRFYTVPGDPAVERKSRAMEIAAKTWPEGWAKGGGAAVWGSMVYDPDFNTVYFGTDSAAPLNAEARSPGGGDNLFTNSIVAVDADSGEYKWHYQTVPHDTWDYNANMPIMLAELEIEKKKRKVLMQAPKSGFFYVIDRETGKFISADNYVPVSWASHYDSKTGRPVELPGARYYQNKEGTAVVSPGIWGGHNWQPMSMNPDTGLVYFSAWNFAGFYGVDHKAVLGGVLTDSYVSGTDPDSMKGRGSLIAWDPAQRMARWKIPQELPMNGGTLSTGGNLVFHGTATGKVNAYRSDDGQLLWSKATGSAIHAAPATYAVDGRQIVLVAVGAPTIARSALAAYGASENARGPSRLMAFALEGRKAMPQPDRAPAKIDLPPKLEVGQKTLKEGGDLFNSGSCWICHGQHADGFGGSAPDLRRSPILQSKEAWYEVVVKGAKKENGMLGQAHLSPAEAEAIRSYVSEQAWKEYKRIVK